MCSLSQSQTWLFVGRRMFVPSRQPTCFHGKTKGQASHKVSSRRTCPSCSASMTALILRPRHSLCHYGYIAADSTGSAWTLGSAAAQTHNHVQTAHSLAHIQKSIARWYYKHILCHWHTTLGHQSSDNRSRPYPLPLLIKSALQAPIHQI